MKRERDRIDVLLRKCFANPTPPARRVTVTVGQELENILGLPKFTGDLEDFVWFAHG